MNSKNKNKILLIMPPQKGLLSGFATGLISIANFVEAMIPEVSTEILDLTAHSFCSAKIEITRSLTKEQKQTVFAGITTTTASYQSALEIAKFIKQVNHQTVVIFGGHHASADPEIVLRSHPQLVDLVVIGEGERSFCELIRHYPTLRNVSGLAFLDDTGHFILTDAYNGPQKLDNMLSYSKSRK
ncbi:MAG: cobalamin-dependent protein, partial [Nitrospirae bacterium]|nr:cobalamin-dependent protein [Nitrospirota bacterium]